MKIKLIYPPQWTPLNPHFSLLSLIAHLRASNHDVSVRDLNIEFYNKVLTNEYISSSINKALKSFDALFNDLAKEFKKNKKSSEYSLDFQKKLAKYTKIKEFKENRSSEINRIPKLVENAVEILKCKERFYKPEQLIDALNTIDAGLELASLPYFPSLLQFHDYYNPFQKLTFESIKEHCLDKSTNMFYQLLMNEIPSILADNPDMIGISINSSSQIIPGLTLAMLLKKQTKAHINIGGNFFGRVVETFKDYPEFFKIYCDSLIVEEGEKPLLELVNHLEGKIPVEQVSNLAYIEENQVKINPTTKPLTLNEMHAQDLEGFPLDLYFTPDIVLSAQSSRGCYWRKCSFCDQDFGQNFNIKDVDKLVDELKTIKEKFGIRHFEFIDESISPAYLQEMSQKLIESNVDINWFINARLESTFTKELLEKGRSSGLRMLLWGFESGSERIMELINKGIDFNKRLDILKNSSDSDIWNFAYIFFGFPSETWEDGLKTIDIISNNTDLIHSYGRSVFTLGKHTRLRENPEKYYIKRILENEEELSPSYQFETTEGMDSKKISEIANLCTVKCNEAYNKPLWMYLRYREILFLYICKYGSKTIQNTKLS